MATKVTVTCPDRKGDYPGFFSAAGFFPVGETTVDLEDAVLAVLEGEVARGESILTVKRVDTKKAK